MYQEELRLLYVGFTRAPDMLMLITRSGQPSAWLELLKAPWLVPLDGDSETIMDGFLGPARVPYRTRIIQPPVSIVRKEAISTCRWFPEPVQPTAKLPALIAPSKQPGLASAQVVQTIRFGTRSPVSGSVSEDILGEALHAIFAAEFINPRHPDRIPTIERIMQPSG